VVPSRNIGNLTKCVSQLREMGETGRVIVVDDGITIDTLEDDNIFCCDENLQVETGRRPFIFARNCNQGITVAGTDDVVLLNDDALLKDSPHGFELLGDICHSFGYGAMCPGFTVGSVGTHNLINRMRYDDAIREEKTMLVFACVYIPRNTIDRVGLLDERFAVNAGGPGARGYGLEDDDYSLRIRQAGLKLGVYDGVLVDHLPDSTGLKSTFRHDPEHPHDVRAHEDVFAAKHGHWPEGHGFAPGRSKPR
jgi:glycosyltransferase involved in cell wall biosynthesis